MERIHCLIKVLIINGAIPTVLKIAVNGLYPCPMNEVGIEG